MATKYQCEKAIKKLSEQTAGNRNVQGYGIGKAKDHGRPNEEGFVVLTYVANMQEVQKKQTEAKKTAPITKKAATLVSDEVMASAVQKPAKRALKRKPLAKKALAKNPLPEKPIDYPTRVETTSRKKKIKIPVQYIETGAFGFS